MDTQVVEKKITRLEAEIGGVPKPQIVWLKNGEVINLDERIQAHDAKGGVYQLLIKNSRKDDTGVYLCRAINEIGQAECTAQLVIEMQPQFLKKLEKLEAVESCEAEWGFQLIGIPKPIIEFTRNNEVLDLEKEKEFYILQESEDHFYTLKFTQVRKKDVGNWTCSATNSAGKASCVAKLETMPLSPPKFIKELSDCRLPEDLDNKIEVKVSGVPFPKIEWSKDGRIIDFNIEGSKYKSERDMNTGSWILIILNCKKESDSGIYKARIYNPGGECSSEGKVIVKGHPPKFLEKPEKVYALSNSVAQFAALVDGDPFPTVSWAKGRNPILENNENKIYFDEQIGVNFFEIQNTKSKDAGTYQVTATNEFGSVTEPVTLIITQNEEDVVDLKSMLKNRNYQRAQAQEEEADFGKLRKAGVIQKPDQDEGEKIKLRHVEREKLVAEEIKESVQQVNEAKKKIYFS